MVIELTYVLIKTKYSSQMILRFILRIGLIYVEKINALSIGPKIETGKNRERKNVSLITHPVSLVKKTMC